MPSSWGLWGDIGTDRLGCLNMLTPEREVAYFPPEDLEAARNWLLWPDGVTEQI